MSKNPIIFVLIAIMMFGNALPLSADSAKRTPELRRREIQSDLQRTSHLLVELDPVVVGNCDEYYDDLINQAIAAAAVARKAVVDAANAAIDLVNTQLLAILNATPTPTVPEMQTALTNATAAINAISILAQAAVEVIDGALAATIAALQLARAICNGIYSS